MGARHSTATKMAKVYDEAVCETNRTREAYVQAKKDYYKRHKADLDGIQQLTGELLALD